MIFRRKKPPSPLPTVETPPTYTPGSDGDELARYLHHGGSLERVLTPVLVDLAQRIAQLEEDERERSE